jgi:HEAT repeat protein
MTTSENLTPEQILTRLEESRQQEGGSFAVYDHLVRDESLSTVIAALRAARDPVSRQVLCDVLGDRKEEPSIPALLERLDDPAPGVRSAAADALGKVFGYVDVPPPAARRREVLDALLVRWEVEGSDDVRSTLAQTLALLGDPSVRPLLEAAADHPDHKVRGQARWGLDHLARRQP